jgi:hypothetical protein
VLFVVLAIVAVAGIALALASNSSKKTPVQTKQPLGTPAATAPVGDPVTSGITVGCEPQTDQTHLTAAVTVRNTGTGNANYSLVVEFDDPEGHPLTQTATSVRGLAGGTTRSFEVTTAAPAHGGRLVGCRLASATRRGAAPVTSSTDASSTGP